MEDFFMDCLFDTLKMVPFLFVAFLIIELVEHKLSEASKEKLSASGKFGPLLGGILGAFPQCGFSVLATNLYITRIVSLGTLIAVYLSTSDEMIPVLLSNNIPLIDILKIVSLKVVVGIVFGFIIDYILRYRKSPDYQICENDTCDCKESIIKSAIIHTLKTITFIFIFSLIMGLVFVIISKDDMAYFFNQHKILAPMISSLIGIIPNCGASILITQLYVSGVISFGTTMSGLLTGSGVAIVLLFRSNENVKESSFIALLLYLIGVLVGMLINVWGIL